MGPVRLSNFGNLYFAKRADAYRQRNKMHRLEKAGRAAILRSDAPQQKVADGLRDLLVRLLARDNRVFVVDQRVRILSRSVDQRKTLISRGAGVSVAAAAVTVSRFGSKNFPA